MEQHTHEHHKLPTYSALPQIEAPLDEYLGQKAPQIPEKWRQLIAKISPWLTLIALVFTIPAILALLGLNLVSVAAVGAVGLHRGPGYTVFLVVMAATFVLEILAVPGLFKRSKQGWVYVFYASLISTALNILTFNVGSLLGSVISLYILFQVKNQYR